MEKKVGTQELTIEELTAEAMQLLTLRVDELYAVLGCQLTGATRPARVAELVSHQIALKSLIESQGNYASLLSGTALPDWARRFNFLYDELEQEGIGFLNAAREELCKGIGNQEIFDLSNEITSSTMQIIVLIVTAVLKLPRQMEAVSATVAAIVCKSRLREFSTRLDERSGNGNS
jgi:hypothetical protein